MNLLFLDSVERDTFGGYENWILLAADYFVRKGYPVTAVGRSGSEYLRRAAAFNSQIETVGLPISGDFNPLTIYRLRSLLAQERIDLMVVNFNKDVRLGGLAARWYGSTRVCWRLGLDITANGWAHRFFSPRLVDGVIVPSHALKKQVMRHGYLRDDMIRVIHNGTEDKAFVRPDPVAQAALRRKYQLSDHDLVAVVAGRFVDQKGHIYLVEAATQIVAQVPQVRFLLLGNGPLEPLLKQRIAELKLDKYFVFAGMLDNIDAELAGADLMVHPAVEEPFSHSILEGMRAGLPIVASNVGGVPEALADEVNALLVPSKDPVLLAKAVVRMLKDAGLRDRFSQATQARWREQFRADAMMLQVEEYFELLLAKRSN